MGVQPKEAKGGIKRGSMARQCNIWLAVSGSLWYNGVVPFEGLPRFVSSLPSIIQNFAFCSNCDHVENRKAVFFLKTCNYTKLKFCKNGAQLETRSARDVRLIVGKVTVFAETS